MAEQPTLLAGGALLGDPEEDLGGRYMAERAEALRQEDDPFLWAERYSQPADAAPPPEPAAKDTPEALRGLGPYADIADAGIRAFLGGAALQRRASEMAGRAGRDLGRGIVESPLAVARGAAGAVQNVFKTADDVATWLNENVADLTVPTPDWVPAWVNNPARGISDAAASARGLISERESATGKAVEFTAQWLTSAAMTRNIGKAFNIQPGVWGRLVNDFAAGAVGFDPREKRLSNIIDEKAPNPITDWLKAKDDDPEGLARIKAGLETAGLSAVAEGVTRGLKLLKAWKASRAPEQAAAGAAPKSVAGEAAAPTALKAANENAVQLSDDLTEKAAAFLRGEAAEAPVKVNLARFEGGDDIIKAIGDISRALPEQDVIPMGQTLQAARDLGMQAGDLAAAVQSGIFDRRQIAAGWMLYRSASEQVFELARKARLTQSPEDIAKFNAGFQTAYGILQTVKGQSAEIARALQIHTALRKSEPDMVKGLQKLIDEAGGSQVALDMAEKIAAFNDPSKAAQFLAEAGRATTRDQITYVWSNILLSNPTSHAANVADTTLSTLAQVPETWFASKLGGDVAAGEATARLYGIVQGMKDGWRLAARSLRTGESAYAGPATRVEGQFVTGQDLVRGGVARQAGDYLRMLIPTRIMQAGDELTKTMNFRGEAHALAWREAARQGLEGAEAAAFARNLVENMPESIQAAASAQAIKGTFNEPLQGVAAGLAQAVDRANVANIPVGRIIVPFIRTPTNILRWTLHRTPAAFLSPQIQAEIAAGGASRDMALGRIAAGSTLLAAMADFAMQGRITGAGPKDPELRAALVRTGWQPYSVKVGDQWVSYQRSGTLGSLLGIAADATELMGGVYSKDASKIDMDGLPVEESVAAAAVMPFAQALLNKTYMQGAAQLVDALQDPQRYGEGWMQKLASSVVPSGVGAVERAVDPEIRRAQDALDAIRARIPGLSPDLPPRLNLWGEPIRDENGIYNLFLPARVSAEKGTAIDQELLRLRIEAAPPKQVQAFSLGGQRVNVKLDPEVHNRLIQLAGNDLKIKGPAGELGARDFLDAIIEGKAGQLSSEYAQGSDEKRELIIREVMHKYRDAARDALMRERPDLRELVSEFAKESAAAVAAPRSPGGLTLGGGLKQ